MRLPAEIDVFSAPDITGALCEVLDAGGPGLIVDMSGMGRCDSACLGALVRAARRARGWGSWVRVVVPDPAMRKMVRLVTLDEMMPLHASVAEAVAAAGSETATVTAGVLSRAPGCRPSIPLRGADPANGLTVAGVAPPGIGQPEPVRPGLPAAVRRAAQPHLSN